VGSFFEQQQQGSLSLSSFHRALSLSGPPCLSAREVNGGRGACPLLLPLSPCSVCVFCACEGGGKVRGRPLL
jgi:hypothetical protein